MNQLNLRPTFYRPRGLSEVRSGWRAETTGDVFTHNGTSFELVVGARVALAKGERVAFSQVVDLYPTDRIEANERGLVSHVDKETGTVSVWLEGYHMGLGDNTLTITPHHDEDTLKALTSAKATAKASNGTRWSGVLASLALGLLLPVSEIGALVLGALALASWAYERRRA
jgi:hypothetical protein